MSDYKIEQGYSVIPEIAAFLGGIFFTTLIFVVDKKSSFSELFRIWTFELPISEYRLICIFLSTTSLLFMLSAIIFGMSYGQDKSVRSVDLYYARNLFLIGCLSTLLSIYVLFSIIDPFIAILQLLVSMVVFIRWIMLAND